VQILLMKRHMKFIFEAPRAKIADAGSCASAFAERFA